MSANAPQLLVLGAGLQPDGLPTLQTHERALSAALYYEQVGYKRVVFSGGHSLLTPERGDGDSEASLMARIATDSGLPEDVVVLEEASTTTATNFLYSESLLLDGAPVDVMAHASHMQRALFLGRKVLGPRVRGVEALGEYPESSFRQDRISLAVTRLALLGVRPGDAERVATRNKRLEAVASGITPLLRRTVFRGHPATQ